MIPLQEFVTLYRRRLDAERARYETWVLNGDCLDRDSPVHGTAISYAEKLGRIKELIVVRELLDELVKEVNSGEF